MSVLNKSVLVLNRSWIPIRVASMEEALVKLTSDYESGDPKAKIIDPTDYSLYTWDDWSQFKPKDGEEVIHGVQQHYKIPEVILVAYDQMPQQRTRFSRKMLYERDGHHCQYCGKKFPTEELNIDHIMPRAQGGKTTWENCVISCVSCNMKKNSRTPEQAGMSLIRKPFKPKFSLFKTRKIPNSWQKFVSEMYWSVPLEKD